MSGDFTNSQWSHNLKPMDNLAVVSKERFITPNNDSVWGLLFIHPNLLLFSSQFHVFIWNMDEKKVLCKIAMNSRCFNPLLLRPDYVLVSSNSNKVLGFRMSEGWTDYEKIFEIGTGGYAQRLLRLREDSDLVLVVSYKKKLTIIDPIKKEVWKELCVYTEHSRINFGLCGSKTHPGWFYFAHTSNNKRSIVLVDPYKNRIVKTFSAHGNNLCYGMQVLTKSEGKEILYSAIITPNGSNVVMYDPISGSIIRTIKLACEVYSMIATGNTLILGRKDGCISTLVVGKGLTDIEELKPQGIHDNCITALYPISARSNELKFASGSDDQHFTITTLSSDNFDFSESKGDIDEPERIEYLKDHYLGLEMKISGHDAVLVNKVLMCL